MDVGGDAPGGAAAVGGAVFHFCSRACRSAFEQAPADYAALARRVPDALARIWELARNLWWTWHPEATALLASLADVAEEPLDHNPLRALASAPSKVLEARAADLDFLARYGAVLRAFDAHMAPNDGRGHCLPQAPQAPIAYFSAEFGVHSSLPVYSGGLGVLAGDFAKEASDLGLPLTGVGFMYPQGYFRQRVRESGRQEETYERLRRAVAPAVPACTDGGRPCSVELQLPDRRLHVAVWIVRVGRVPLYLMDTDLAANSPWDRELSARLYGGDQETRIRQEILLGIGGVRMLRALGIAPAVWHANEGHAAFMMLERVRELIAAGASFETAVEDVRGSTVFTTHTPVAAGHDVFPFSLVERYLAPYWPALGLDRERFMALGAYEQGWGPSFNMTTLALRLSGSRNAVSRRHGEVARRMWRGVWPALPEDEVPITAITNGVHMPSWVASEFDRLYRTYLGEDWRSRHDSPEVWEGVEVVPDAELWRARRALKHRLLSFLRGRARRGWAEGRLAPAAALAGGALLEPDILTLGFARRFATYKRASLIFRNPTRLQALLTDPRRPIQIIFAGKAHPADEPAKEVLQTVYRASLDPAYGGRIAFVEDYDMRAAQYLVQGVDVWLNLPRPPLEASGTSGQKAAVNGVPSLSVLDGWWAEAYDGTNGWAVGADAGDHDAEDRDGADADSLYGLLASVVAPLYYDRGPDGIPSAWLRVVRRAIQTVSPRFSARRMLKEYVERLYVPAARGRPRAFA